MNEVLDFIAKCGLVALALSCYYAYKNDVNANLLEYEEDGNW